MQMTWVYQAHLIYLTHQVQLLLNILFQPSSSTFVKHFLAEMNDSVYSDGLAHIFIAGYFNTTTALTRVQFKMSSGNIDSGTIKMYGVT